MISRTHLICPPAGTSWYVLRMRRAIDAHLIYTGGLTDAILALARRHRAAFLCCPCCFLKHPHLRQLAHESEATPSFNLDSSLLPASYASHLVQVPVDGAAAAALVSEVHNADGHARRAHQHGSARVSTRCAWCDKVHGGRFVL